MEPAEQKIEDIKGQYPDEWVFMQVTRERRWQASHGIVLGHGGDEDREALSEQGRAFLESHPETQIFVFWTGKLIPDGLVIIPPFVIDQDQHD
ncbi:MAG: hypothetical protein Q7R39_19785 [Dehalococcoidia bacterium]|nr:hypothetical protein [Dehalococcoidia bacterium]